MRGAVAAIVVTYNRKDLLLECIEALKSQVNVGDFDIIVIDNASSDGTYEALDEAIRAGWIIYENTGANLGGAGGFNFGVRYAVEHDYKLLWIMDDDCIPKSDALAELFRASAGLPEEWGFLASRVEWIDGSLCAMNEVKLDRTPCNHSGLLPCRQASFVSLFLNSKAVVELGLPIKDFFIWGDDVEYTRRISAVRPSYYVGSSVVTHKTKNNAGSDISRDNEERLPRYRYAYRNEAYIARKEGPSRMFYQVAKVALHLCRILVNASSKRKERWEIVLSGSKEGFSFNPVIEYCDRRGSQ